MKGDLIYLASLLYQQSYYDGDSIEVRRGKAQHALQAAQVFYEEAQRRKQHSSPLKRFSTMLKQSTPLFQTKQKIVGKETF